MNVERRINRALDASELIYSKCDDIEKVVAAISERCFPNGCPNEAGPMLGAYNMLSNLLSLNDGIRSDLSDLRSAIIPILPDDGDDSDIFSEL